jgi:hypothetical protein
MLLPYLLNLSRGGSILFRVILYTLAAWLVFGSPILP